MRILYFSLDFTPHDSRFLSSLAKAQNQVGFLMLERDAGSLEQDEIPPGVDLIHWGRKKKPAALINVVLQYKAFQSVLKEFKPDVILAGPIQRPAFLASLSGFNPLVTISWGYDLLRDARRNFLWRWVTQFTLKKSAIFIGDCETIRKAAISYGAEPEQMVIFPYGADLRKFEPGDDNGLRRRIGWGDEHFVFLSNRSWEPVYGVVDLVAAFVVAARENQALRLLLLGDGSQAGEIRRMVAKAGMEDKVYIAGRVSQDELPRYYRAGDVYVSASYVDGTSISLLEAFATGLPVLVSDIPSNREWVSSGKTGWLFPAGNVQVMAEAMRYVYTHRDKLKVMGTSGRKLVEEKGNWEKNSKKLLEALNMAVCNEE